MSSIFHTLPAIIMEEMGPSNISFLSFRVIFHFHDYGRKGNTWPIPYLTPHCLLSPWGICIPSYFLDNSGYSMLHSCVRTYHPFPSVSHLGDSIQGDHVQWTFESTLIVAPHSVLPTDGARKGSSQSERLKSWPVNLPPCKVPPWQIKP